MGMCLYIRHYLFAEQFYYLLIIMSRQCRIIEVGAHHETNIEGP